MPPRRWDSLPPRMAAEILASIETHANLVGFCFLLAIALPVYLLARDPMLRADARSAAALLFGAILLRVAYLGALTLDAAGIASLCKVVALILGSFGALRLGVAVGLRALRLRGTPTPKILRDVVDVILYAIALGIILKTTFAIDLSSFLATSALLSIILGLALQDTLGNLFAGLSLQMEHPFEVGDWLKTPDYTGRVLELSWRAVKIETRRYELITLPNAMLAKGSIVNLSRQLDGPVACELTFGVDQDAPPNFVKREILAAVHATPHVRATPAADVVAVDYQDATARYQARFWVDRYEDARGAQDAVTTLVWYRLRRARIELSAPTRVVTIKQPPATPMPMVDSDADGNVMTGSAALDALRAMPFFEGLAEDDLKVVAAHARRVIFGAGETIVKHGDHPDRCFLVVEGAVELSTNDKKKERLPVQAGEFFGAMALLETTPQTFTAVAKTDVALLTLDREGFAAAISRDSGLPRLIQKVHEERTEAVESAPQSTHEHQDPTASENIRLLDRLQKLFRS